jgi:hypothetical protein
MGGYESDWGGYESDLCVLPPGVGQHRVTTLARSIIVVTLAVFGAHLDSVPEGPGLNDNGGSSLVITLITATTLIILIILVTLVLIRALSNLSHQMETNQDEAVHQQ